MAKWTFIKGDLFDHIEQQPCNTAIVHCVSQCFHMNAGIAKQFKKNVGRVDELLDQKTEIGDVAILVDGPQNELRICYLVTKSKYFHTSSYASLEASLVKLRDYCVRSNIKYLKMPKIGCGLDKLEWKHVKSMIDIYFDKRFVIDVYVL